MTPWLGTAVLRRMNVLVGDTNGRTRRGPEAGFEHVEGCSSFDPNASRGVDARRPGAAFSPNVRPTPPAVFFRSFVYTPASPSSHPISMAGLMGSIEEGGSGGRGPSYGTQGGGDEGFDEGFARAGGRTNQRAGKQAARGVLAELARGGSSTQMVLALGVLVFLLGAVAGALVSNGATVSEEEEEGERSSGAGARNTRHVTSFRLVRLSDGGGGARGPAVTRVVSRAARRLAKKSSVDSGFIFFGCYFFFRRIVRRDDRRRRLT